MSAVGADVSTSNRVAEAADGAITGTVYQDFNSNGANDTTVASGQATDVGLAGITVKAFDSTGALVGETTSGANGAYSLSVTGSAGAAVRVEFSLPASGPLAAMRPSFAGTQNGTTIRFVDIGATAVDIGFNVPGEFCQNNPNISVSRLCAGTGAAVDSSPSAWVAQYDGGPYSAPTANVSSLTDVFNNWTATKAATKTDTGSILGMTWDPSTRKVYHSAYIRRHAELYESGGTPRPGAIFMTTPGGTTAAQGTGGSTSFLVDLETLIAGDQFSNSNPAGPGFIPTNADRMISRMMNGNNAAIGDSGADNDGVDSDFSPPGKVGVFEEVGKAGIGDIETDGRGKLWAVSLYDKNLYQVTLPASGTPTQMVSLGDVASGVTCTNGVGRPFSVKLWRGSLYLGVVCDGSGDFNPATYDDSNPATLGRANLSFTIVRYDLASSTISNFFGPQPLTTSANVFKGRAYHTRTDNTSAAWNPWTDSFVSENRPVPMLSEIEFDRDGSMILAFRDRNGDQMGLLQSENPDGTGNGRTDASGDLYRVCRTGAGYATSDYVFEGSAGCAQASSPTATFGTEYYVGDHWVFNSGGWGGHGETLVGMSEQVPGFPEVLSTSYDPYSYANLTYYSGGVRWLLNSTGDANSFPNAGSGVMFYNGTLNGGLNDTPLGPNSAGGFMKTNGMSDIEALCDQAPLQIGNRVWIDTDKDGIQDPGETPVAGATVRLYDAAGTLVGTAITNASGEYYFASNVTEAAAGDGNNIGGGLAVDAAFTIKLDNPADYASGGPLNGYLLTSTDSTSSATSDADNSIDNDSSLSGGSTYGVDKFPSISVVAHGPGENDHTFDFGFVQTSSSPTGSTSTSSSPKVSVGDYVWWDIDRDGLQDKGETPIVGVTLSITKADGSPVTDVFGQPVTTTTTDANGKYSFDNLPLGQYKVTIVPPSGATATKASSGKNVAKDSSTGSATSRNMTTDGDRDPTLDFGFYKPSVSLGNKVWRDRNGDGIQGPEDVGLGGFKLTVRTIDGKPVRDVYGRPVRSIRTKSDGSYSFDNLPPGQYQVEIAYPLGYLPTTANRSDRGRNSSTLYAKTKVLAGGQSDITLDFGVVSRPGQRFRLLPATL